MPSLLPQAKSARRFGEEDTPSAAPSHGFFSLWLTEDSVLGLSA